jgi:hypothetical protein
VFPAKYKLSFYISKDGIIHSHSRENLKSYIALNGWALQRRRNVTPVKYDLGFYMPEDSILHCYRREDIKPYIFIIFLGWGKTESTWYIGHYLAYCSSPE